MKINRKFIEEMIKERGLKKKWVAEQLGMSAQNFKELLENGKTFKTVEKLAAFFDVDPKDLIL